MDTCFAIDEHQIYTMWHFKLIVANSPWYLIVVMRASTADAHGLRLSSLSLGKSTWLKNKCRPFSRKNNDTCIRLQYYWIFAFSYSTSNCKNKQLHSAWCSTLRGAVLFMVQHSSWCGTFCGVSLFVVQRSSWCSTLHVAALFMVWHILWYFTLRGAALFMVRRSSCCGALHGVAQFVVFHSSWCSTLHGAALFMLRRSSWCGTVCGVALFVVQHSFPCGWCRMMPNHITSVFILHISSTIK